MISDRRVKELEEFVNELTSHEMTFLRGLLRESRQAGMLLLKHEVAKWARISEVHVNNLLARGKFPEPILFGNRTPRWEQSTLDAWVGKFDCE